MTRRPFLRIRRALAPFIPPIAIVLAGFVSLAACQGISADEVRAAEAACANNGGIGSIAPLFWHVRPMLYVHCANGTTISRTLPEATK